MSLVPPALALWVLGAVAGIPEAEQERDAPRSEQVADEVGETAADFCRGLRSLDSERVAALLSDDFAAVALDGKPPIGREALDEALASHMRQAAVIRRCSLKAFNLVTDRKHAHAVARLSLVISGLDRSGQRFSDRGDVQADLVRVDQGWRFRAMEFGPRLWSSGQVPQFMDVTADVGIASDFHENIVMKPTRAHNLQNLWINGGLSVVDVDGDGLPDIYVSREGPNLFYRNDGDGHFTEMAAKMGIADPGDSRSALFVDLDNDGDLDLFVANVADPGSTRRGNRLYRNDGNGHFTDVTEHAGVGQRGYYSTVTAADVDHDGLLDLFVGQYQRSDLDHPPLDAHNGRPSLLLHNLGGLRFQDVAARAGVAGHEWTLASRFADLDGDGLDDLIVVNDFGAPRVYRNRSRRPGEVRFEEITQASGIIDPGNGMGVDVADYDGDGLPDVYISKMYSKAGNRLLSQTVDMRPDRLQEARVAARGNSLFHNDGNGHFTEVGETAGVRRAGWAWSCEFADVDNDGHPDLYVANGFFTGKRDDDL